MVPILPICLDLRVITPEVNLVVPRHNACKVTTDIIGLLKVEEVWFLALALCACSFNHDPANGVQP